MAEFDLVFVAATWHDDGHYYLLCLKENDIINLQMWFSTRHVKAHGPKRSAAIIQLNICIFRNPQFLFRGCSLQESLWVKPLAPFQEAPPSDKLSLARSGQMSPSSFDPVTGAQSPQSYRRESLSSVTLPKANIQGNGCWELLERISTAPGGAQRFGRISRI